MRIVKKALLFLITFVLININSPICFAQDKTIDYDFGKLSFDTVRSIGYNATDVGRIWFLYFKTDNLLEALQLIEKDRDTILKLALDAGGIKGLSEEFIIKYMSKAALLSYLLSNKTIKAELDFVYKAVIVRYQDSDKIALAKYKIEPDKMYVIRLNEKEKKEMEKTRIRESSDYHEEYNFYRILGLKNEIAIHSKSSDWLLKEKTTYDFSGYILAGYRVKSDEALYEHFEYFVVPNYEYLLDLAYDPTTDYTSKKEAYEISIPSDGFYWNGEYPDGYYLKGELQK